MQYSLELPGMSGDAEERGTVQSAVALEDCPVDVLKGGEELSTWRP